MVQKSYMTSPCPAAAARGDQLTRPAPAPGAIGAATAAGRHMKQHPRYRANYTVSHSVRIQYSAGIQYSVKAAVITAAPVIDEAPVS